MTALVTCAHVGAFAWPFGVLGPVLRDIYRHRHIRAEECRESLDALVSYGDVFKSVRVVECVARRVPAYISQRKDCIGAVSRNSLSCSNKGIQEFANIGSFLACADMPDNEMMLKLTARYLVLKPDFLEFCATSPCDAVVRRDRDIWGEKGRGVHTFLFAARKGLLLDFAGWLLSDRRYTRMEKMPVEWIFGDYLESSGCSVAYYPGRLNVLARYSPPLEATVV